MTVPEVLAEVSRDRVFFEESGGGLSLSGGEPVMQFDFVRCLLRACREEGIHTAIDTSGYALWEQLLAVAELADLVLYDLKLMDSERHVRYTGVSNAVILENLVALGCRHDAIWIRVPVIPGVNDDPAELQSMARFAAGVTGVRRLCLLPYHELGGHKSRSLGRPYRMNGTATPNAEQLDRAAQVFRNAGLDVMIGR